MLASVNAVISTDPVNYDPWSVFAISGGPNFPVAPVSRSVLPLRATTSAMPLTVWRFHVLTWIVSPSRNASSATFALN
ncbi:hypothetical protein KPG71_17380 [Roseovarius sp. PS-C2]|nr:hypothetical protein [Roseovarius sp. PS-C2]